MVSQSDLESEEVYLTLDDWDNWFGTVDSDIHALEFDDYDEVMDDIWLSLTFLCEQIILLSSQFIFFYVFVSVVSI